MDAAGGGCSASFALWEEMDSVDDVVEDESSSVTLGISTGASLEAASTRARRLEAAEASLGVTARAFGGELVMMLMMLMMLMSWCGEGYLLPWSRERIGNCVGCESLSSIFGCTCYVYGLVLYVCTWVGSFVLVCSVFQRDILYAG